MLVMGERAKFSLQVQCLLLYTNNSRRHLDVRAHDPAGRPKSVLFPIYCAIMDGCLGGSDLVPFYHDVEIYAIQNLCTVFYPVPSFTLK